VDDNKATLHSWGFAELGRNLRNVEGGSQCAGSPPPPQSSGAITQLSWVSEHPNLLPRRIVFFAIKKRIREMDGSVAHLYPINNR